MSKTRFMVAGILLTILLTSCNITIPLPSNKSEPSSLTIDNVVYRNGFYENLWLQDFEEAGDPYSIDGDDFYHLKNTRYDCVHSNIGSDSEGMLYCAEDEWDDANAYYSNPDNYLYYCHVGNGTNPQRYNSIEINEFDSEKFDELEEFESQSEYDPFDSLKNEKIDKIRFPMSEVSSTVLVFF